MKTLTRPRRPAILSVVFVLLTAALGAEQMRIATPTLYVESQAEEKTLKDAFADAAFTVSRELAEGLDISLAWEDGRSSTDIDYELSYMASSSEGSRSLMIDLRRNSDGRSAESFVVLREWDDRLAAYLSQVIPYMLSSLEDFPTRDGIEAPVFFQSLNFSAVDSVYRPLSGDVGPDGNLVIAAGVGFQFDPYFRLIDQPGEQLLREGLHGYAGDVRVTPSGSIVFKSSGGDQIHRFAPEIERPQTLRSGLSGYGPYAVLDDGSIVVADINSQRAVSLESGGRRELSIFPPQMPYIAFIGAGPEGNIWVPNTVGREILIYSPRGELIDSIIPKMPAGEMYGVKGIANYPNGDFLLLSATSLTRFSREGDPLWKLTSLPSPEGGGFAVITAVTLDPERGLVYLVDTAGNRIVQLIEPSAEDGWIEDATVAELLSINEAILADPFAVDGYLEKAKVYERIGASYLALNQWQQVVANDPFDSDAQANLEDAEIAVLEEQARRLASETRRALEDLGVESARALYSRTVQRYERILSRDPEADEAREELDSLQEDFRSAERGPLRPQRPLTISSIEMGNIFPSLMQTYQNDPLGTVELVNDTGVEVASVELTVELARYMDFPHSYEIATRLGPGESVNAPIHLLLNPRVLEVQEDLPVQLSLTVAYASEGSAAELSRNAVTTLHRNSALVWDDSAKLAAFVTPNEDIVAGFALRAAELGGSVEELELSNELLRATRVIEALGAFNLAYVEDPEAPFSEIQGDLSFVDTVRYPRQTLLYRSGDCDDTTALLASMLEAVSVSTGIITSPGHVFLAFDTGEPSRNAWMFEAEGRHAFVHDETVWLPIETTILSEGFEAAWQEGSRLMKVHEPRGEIEFIPMSEARRSYPTLPLAPSTMVLAEPRPSAVSERFSLSVSRLRETLYEQTASRLESELSGRSGRARARLLNQIGILAARFADLERSETAFQSAIEADTSYTAARVNLANVRIMNGELESALAALEPLGERDRRPAIVDLALARVYHGLGEQAQAARYLEAAESTAPELAARYAYLRPSSDAGENAATASNGTGAAGVRASEANREGLFLWGLD